MQSRRIATDGLTQQVLEAGPADGPLVLLIHGFPELGISWRAQVQALSEAGYHTVAPDMRGYGGTDKPAEAEAHTILHLVGDMVDLVRALARDTGGRTECIVVGHDWGAPVAWHCALTRPDLFKAVFGLSVPFQPRRPKGPPTPAMAAISKRLGRGELYMNQFQSPDAHRMFEADVATALRKGFYAYDGSTPDERRSTGFIAPGHDFLSEVADDATLPPWMSAEHFAEYVEAFSRSGFKGPIDWYRCLDLNWSLTAHLQDQKITVPAFFMVGDHDPVRHYAGQHEAGMKDWMTDLRGQVVVPGAGHWIQQERPEVVNEVLLGFLGAVSDHRAVVAQAAADQILSTIKNSTIRLGQENEEWLFHCGAGWLATRSLWRLTGSEGIEATSRQGVQALLFPEVETNPYAGPSINERLALETVIMVTIDPRTSDLTLGLSGGAELTLTVDSFGHAGSWAFGRGEKEPASLMADAGGVISMDDAVPFHGSQYEARALKDMLTSLDPSPS